jgi:hypothetical protein
MKRGDLDVSSGHFHFINKFIRKCQDSYSLGWQNKGSNGFCQTFALMGALGMDTVFQGKTKEHCSQIACEFLLDNNSKWFKKYWKKLCINKKYYNIQNLSIDEIKKDIHMSMIWGKKGTIFWELILSEEVYISVKN